MVGVCDDECAGAILKTGKHAQRNIVLAGELHRAYLQYLGAETGQLQHLLNGNGIETLCLGADPRISRVDPIHIGVDLTFIGTQRSSQRHPGSIGAPTPKRGDIALFIHPLEAGNHDHLALIQVVTHFVGLDALNTRLRVRAVRHDPDLRAGVGSCRHTQLV